MVQKLPRNHAVQYGAKPSDYLKQIKRKDNKVSRTVSQEKFSAVQFLQSDN